MAKLQPGRAVDGNRMSMPGRGGWWWAVAAVLSVGAACLWTLDPEPPRPVAVTQRAGPAHLPAKSPLLVGTGTATMAPKPAPALSGRTARLAGGSAHRSSTSDSPTLGQQRARFDQLRWFGTDAAQLRTLAREIDAALPGALHAGDIDAGDALVLKADLLDALEPDPGRRRDRLAEWWTAHPLPSQAHQPSHPAAADYWRRELAVLAEWQTQRSEDRDAGELEERLEALQPPRPINSGSMPR